MPTLSITVRVDAEIAKFEMSIEESHHVVPNLVEGWAFGNALGIGLRSSSEWWTVKDIKVTGSAWEVSTTHTLPRFKADTSLFAAVNCAIIERGPHSSDTDAGDTPCYFPKAAIVRDIHLSRRLCEARSIDAGNGVTRLPEAQTRDCMG